MTGSLWVDVTVRVGDSRYVAEVRRDASPDTIARDVMRRLGLRGSFIVTVLPDGRLRDGAELVLESGSGQRMSL